MKSRSCTGLGGIDSKMNPVVRHVTLGKLPVVIVVQDIKAARGLEPFKRELIGGI